ncbi:DUF2970 domain-containing protein [Reinekea sp.]|jgi:hypothetical protein|uniref:DUF2970 domain-containing protein n=1 Tax=Reinekea sp. TaxID=1970455 RepID=UPI003989D603
MNEVEKVNKPTVWRVFKSVLSAAIGVQSEKNRIEDFQSTSIWPFIIGGIIFTAAFVGGLILLVTIVT